MKRLPFENKSNFEFANSFVIEFENKYKFKLPNELIQFLKIQNGGSLENAYFLDTHYINHFFPLYDDRYGTISQRLEFLISEGIQKMIPFAGDDDSMTYCLSIDENNFGKIFSYQSGDWTPGTEPLLKICDTFDEFINSFRIES